MQSKKSPIKEPCVANKDFYIEILRFLWIFTQRNYRSKFDFLHAKSGQNQELFGLIFGDLKIFIQGPNNAPKRRNFAQSVVTLLSLHGKTIT
jgi:hypothetical protein